jgi:hypothetical protein
VNGLRIASAALLLCARAAVAYPHFQLAGDAATCAACHYAPAGGGMLTEFGQEQSADPLSGGGNGAFLHGAVTLPRWVSVGGDVRLAALANDVGSTEGTELAAFPMQADIALRLGTEQLSVFGTAGLWRAVRSDASGPGGLPPLRFISREHYLLWRPGLSNFYVRGGRFHAPYGLRLADHTTYLRRHLGFGLFEEPYALSAGYVIDAWEIHGTAFISRPLEAPVRELGGALLAETRVGDAVLGASARSGFAPSSARHQAGVFAKYWWAESRLMWVAELDAVRQIFIAAPGPPRWQAVAYAGPIWMPVRGLSVGVAYELFAEDLRVRGLERHAVDAWAAFLPWAHFEIMLSARAQRIGPDGGAWAGLLQLHYYL